MATRRSKPVKRVSGPAASPAATKPPTRTPAAANPAPAAKARSPKPSAKKATPAASASTPTSASDLVDQQLAKYRSMRDFGITAEPSGAAAAPVPATGGTLPFCIQKHAASHLHYDFRLGWNGVLKSWAVAKGPSYFTGDKRLAVQVEDHPIDYGGFEGIIPRGQYGGGTVMLWDEGTWAPQPGHEDVDAGLRDGSLKFLLFGSKMRGKWTLIRMSGKAAQERKPNWLLIKEHDDQERPRDAPAVTEAEPNSAATGRTMEQIAAEEDHVWNSKDTAKSEGRAWYRKDCTATTAPLPAASAPPRSSHPATLPTAIRHQLDDLPEEPQPEFLKPQLALEATAPPDSDGWLHELKLDGYRMQARKSARGVEMLTRSGLDWTYRIPAVAEAVARLSVRACTLDGEVVVLRDDGTTNFADLQASFQEGARNPLTYFCFDLLHLEGRNPRALDLRARKDLLAAILATGDGDTVRLSEHIEFNGAALFHQACEAHAEGIISKLAASPYRAGRSGDWLKSKCLREQEFVVGGFTLPSNGIHGVGALLLGYYRDDALIYAGRTGTGFTQKTHRLVRDRLDALHADRSAFLNVPAPARHGVVWVRPELVAQVRFATWTAEDLVRQAAFLGLREDKPALEVRREAPEVAPRPKRSRSADHPSPPADKPTIPSVSTQVTKKTPAAPRPAAPQASADDHAPVRLTHPSKLLDQQTGVTKQMLADFYWAVSEQMLPAIAGRPLSLVRCPEGSEKPCFYQKHVTHLLPAGVTAVDVPDKKTGKLDPYITLDTAEALAGLAQMGVLEVHPWGSRNADLEHPDRLIFDLDPDEALPWSIVTSAAFEIRDRLTSIHLESFVKTTGGKGLHIVVPLQPQLDWTQTKDLTHAFVREMERENPALYLTKMTKAARTNRIYLDYLRNERGATAVAPFSPRARAGLPVSLPLAWSELKTPDRPTFRVADFASWRTRLTQNPWKKIETVKQRIDL